MHADSCASCHETDLAAPMSPAACRHLSEGDIFLASGVAGSCPESVRPDPPELLPCSLLPVLHRGQVGQIALPGCCVAN